MALTAVQWEAITASEIGIAETVAAADRAVKKELASRVIGQMTPDEFFAFETAGSNGNTRHELWNGTVVALAGGTPNHNLIGFNMGRALADALDAVGLERRVFSSDQMVQVSDQKRYYPDAKIADAAPRFDTKYALINPVVIVEVLSPSTAAFDLDEKFGDYQKIASLQHYIVIAQDRVRVLHYEKIVDNMWAITGTHENLPDTLFLAIDDVLLSVPVRSIYKQIELP